MTRWLEGLSAGSLTPLAWVGVGFALVVLAFAWLIYITRGRRETRIQFTGLGVSFTVDSSDREPTTVLPKVEIESTEEN